MLRDGRSLDSRRSVCVRKKSVNLCLAIFSSKLWAMSWENLFMPYANNKDQPAHPCSLISAFVVHCLDSIIPLLATARAGRFESYLVENPEDMFSRYMAQILWQSCSVSYKCEQQRLSSAWASLQSYQHLVIHCLDRRIGIHCLDRHIGIHCLDRRIGIHCLDRVLVFTA